jgi:hypothetical protein
MWWGYVSELRLPTGLLFIPQIIYWHGRPRWNDIDRTKAKNTERQLSRVPLCTPQFLYGLPLARTRASGVRGRRITAWAMARPLTLWSKERVVLLYLLKLSRFLMAIRRKEKLQLLWDRNTPTISDMRKSTILISCLNFPFFEYRVKTFNFNYVYLIYFKLL